MSMMETAWSDLYSQTDISCQFYDYQKMLFWLFHHNNYYVSQFLFLDVSYSNKFLMILTTLLNLLSDILVKVASYGLTPSCVWFKKGNHYMSICLLQERRKEIVKSSIYLSKIMSFAVTLLL